MDPITVAAATLVAKWAAEGFVKEAAKSGWEGLKKVYEAVHSRLMGNEEGTKVLQCLEQEPSSQAHTSETG